VAPENYTGRWTGRGGEGAVSWPARSPDLSPLDSFCGCFRKPMSASTVGARGELRRRIQQFSS
jgi:hypothetical protein